MSKTHIVIAAAVSLLAVILAAMASTASAGGAEGVLVGTSKIEDVLSRDRANDGVIEGPSFFIQNLRATEIRVVSKYHSEITFALSLGPDSPQPNEVLAVYTRVNTAGMDDGVYQGEALIQYKTDNNSNWTTATNTVSYNLVLLSDKDEPFTLRGFTPTPTVEVQKYHRRDGKEAWLIKVTFQGRPPRLIASNRLATEPAPIVTLGLAFDQKDIPHWILIETDQEDRSSPWYLDEVPRELDGDPFYTAPRKPRVRP